MAPEMVRIGDDANVLLSYSRLRQLLANGIESFGLAPEMENRRTNSESATGLSPINLNYPLSFTLGTPREHIGNQQELGSGKSASISYAR